MLHFIDQYTNSIEFVFKAIEIVRFVYLQIKCMGMMNVEHLEITAFGMHGDFVPIHWIELNAFKCNLGVRQPFNAFFLSLCYWYKPIIYHIVSECLPIICESNRFFCYFFFLLCFFPVLKSSIFGCLYLNWCDNITVPIANNNNRTMWSLAYFGHHVNPHSIKVQLVLLHNLEYRDFSNKKLQSNCNAEKSYWNCFKYIIY